MMRFGPLTFSHTVARAALLTFLIMPFLLAIAGTPVQAAYSYVRGVNLSGAEFGEGTYPGTLGAQFTYNSEASFTYYGNKGLNIVRIPISWERIQPSLNGALDPTHLGYLNQNIAWAKAHGCQVIIDIHSYARYYLLEGSTRTQYVIDNVYGGVVKVPRSAFADLWSRLSTQYKNETGVFAYGLVNEPHDMGTADWKLISQAAVTAVRNNGDNKLIMVCGNQWAGAWCWPTANGSTSWINDPANNFMYEAHLYFDNNYSGTYGWTYDQELAANANLATVGVNRLKPFTDWCAANKVRGFLGEYGVPDNDPRWLTVLNNFLNALDAAGMGGCYWAGGEWWGGYPLSVQPTNNFTTDRPQTATLLSHKTAAPQYNFEAGTQAWTYSGGMIAGIASSTTRAYEKTRSLAVTINCTNTAGDTQMTYIASPTLPTSKVVTFWVWFPTGSKITGIQPYVQQGAGGGWLFTGNYKTVTSLTAGQWNAITVTVPSNAVMPLYQLGVQFFTNGTWSGTCYVDAVGW